MTPGDIVMMLNEMGGMRVQATSPSLGAASVRIQGMRGLAPAPYKADATRSPCSFRPSRKRFGSRSTSSPAPDAPLPNAISRHQIEVTASLHQARHAIRL